LRSSILGSMLRSRRPCALRVTRLCSILYRGCNYCRLLLPLRLPLQSSCPATEATMLPTLLLVAMVVTLCCFCCLNCCCTPRFASTTHPSHCCIQSQARTFLRENAGLAAASNNKSAQAVRGYDG
jgi:hypothetical protein